MREAQTFHRRMRTPRAVWGNPVLYVWWLCTWRWERSWGPTWETCTAARSSCSTCTSNGPWSSREARLAPPPRPPLPPPSSRCSRGPLTSMLRCGGAQWRVLSGGCSVAGAQWQVVGQGLISHDSVSQIFFS